MRLPFVELHLLKSCWHRVKKICSALVELRKEHFVVYQHKVMVVMECIRQEKINLLAVYVFDPSHLPILMILAS